MPMRNRQLCVLLVCVAATVCAPVAADLLDDMALQMVHPTCDPAVGAAAIKNLAAQGKVRPQWENPEALAACKRIFLQVAQGRKIRDAGKWRSSVGPDWQWWFGVGDDATQLDAFTTGGGYIYLNAALLYSMPDEDAIAAVIAHEMVHGDQRHCIKGMAGPQLAQMLLGRALVPGNSDWEQMLKRLLPLAYGKARSRGHEENADKMGMAYIAQAGFDPAGAVRAMQQLQKLDGRSDANWMADHPTPTQRVAYLQEELKKHPYSAGIHAKSFAMLDTAPRVAGLPNPLSQTPNVLSWCGGYVAFDAAALAAPVPSGTPALSGSRGNGANKVYRGGR